jgi:hypothetical protein
MKKVILLTIFTLFILNSYCFAEKQEWIDKTYDFSKVTRITICEPNIQNYIKNGILEKEIIDTFKSKAKISNVKIVEPLTIINAINADLGIDLLEINKKNPQEALRIIDENSYKYTDIIITSTVNRYGMGSTYEEGFSYNTTSYQNSYIFTPGGATTTVQSPVTQTHNVRGGNVGVAITSVRWDVKDTKTLKNVFSRIDDRSRSNRTRLDNTNPNDLYKRITGSFFDDLNELLNKHKDR